MGFSLLGKQDYRQGWDSGGKKNSCPYICSGGCLWDNLLGCLLLVYRIFSSILFHGSLLHVLFNMLALVPLGSELERIMGSVRLLYIMLLLAVSNALLHLLIALLVAHNPFHPYPYFMDECAIGFSGILFSMIVMETSLSGAQTRSVFGLFNVPAKWYALILLVVFSLL
ncbi:Rhomboid-like protein 15 [Datura stramonium]|uniref:Rhomboid-like protein 15 n=1 Tax=Datura stramonium TaxID=4076 RepID=A0ABS8VD03_DATST|nr:Rhomboid-like protein 15 [Datura stramonium]